MAWRGCWFVPNRVDCACGGGEGRGGETFECAAALAAPRDEEWSEKDGPSCTARGGVARYRPGIIGPKVMVTAVAAVTVDGGTGESSWAMCWQGPLTFLDNLQDVQAKIVHVAIRNPKRFSTLTTNST